MTVLEVLGALGHLLFLKNERSEWICMNRCEEECLNRVRPSSERQQLEQLAMEEGQATCVTLVLHHQRGVQSRADYLMGNDASRLSSFRQSRHVGWQARCRETVGARPLEAGGTEMRAVSDDQNENVRCPSGAGGWVVEGSRTRRDRLSFRLT